ncbi:hypothetical protein SLE2022_068590 [Rubroshorea leprosula]
MALERILLGMGNPLLDISAVVDEDFLNKYDIKLNNAILLKTSTCQCMRRWLASITWCTLLEVLLKILSELPSGCFKSQTAPTGTCAVGGERSMAANLSAANCYKSEHLKRPENWALRTTTSSNGLLFHF